MSLRRGISQGTTVDVQENQLNFMEMVKLLDFQRRAASRIFRWYETKGRHCRALANDPEVKFMDEPFANLDAQTRLLLREELLRIWERDKKTVVLSVTHNIEEAVMLCKNSG